MDINFNFLNNQNKKIKGKLIDSIIDFIFSKNFIIFGGTIRDYIIPPIKKKIYPTDIDIAVEDIPSAINIIKDQLNFCFDITEEIKIKPTIKHAKLILEYKFHSGIVIILDISNKQIIGSNLDFNVNGIYMTDKRTFKLFEILPDNNIMDIFDKISNKKFKIIKTFKPSIKSRIQSGVKQNSLELIEYIKIMERTSKMFSRGWKLDNQDLKDIFEPCLIKKIDNKIENKICELCRNKFNKYELELFCCKKILCFQCALNHLKSRFNNSEISCPYCRGDLFGWKTNKINSNSTNENENEIITDLSFNENLMEYYDINTEEEIIENDDVLEINLEEISLA